MPCDSHSDITTVNHVGQALRVDLAVGTITVRKVRHRHIGTGHVETVVESGTNVPGNRKVGCLTRCGGFSGFPRAESDIRIETTRSLAGHVIAEPMSSRRALNLSRLEQSRQIVRASPIAAI